MAASDPDNFTPSSGRLAESFRLSIYVLQRPSLTGNLIRDVKNISALRGVCFRRHLSPLDLPSVAKTLISTALLIAKRQKGEKF